MLSVLVAALPARSAEVPSGTRLAAKQEITIGNGSEPSSLDPVKSEGNVEYNLGISLFEGLVGHDADGNVIPGVAEKWESRDGGRIWIFTLRKNALWSDGSSVTAADFEFAWKRVADPGTASPIAWYLSKICNILNAEAIATGRKPVAELGIKALADRTLQVTLEQPTGYFVSTLVHNAVFPLPRKVIERHGERWTDADKIVGNGPYRLAARVVNERIDLVRNPHYWNNTKTVIDKVSFLPINNQSAEYQRYRTHALDLISSSGVPNEQIAQIRREIPNELLVWPRIATYFFSFNLLRPPFDDVRVRRALSLAINREVISNQILQGGQIPAYNMTPHIVDGYQHAADQWEKAGQAAREVEARRLLADAGYGPGKPLKVPLLYNTNEQHKKIALAVAAMWKRVGPVEVDLVNQEWKTYLDTRSRGEFAVSRAGWVSNVNEPNSMISLFHSKHGNNDGKYQSAKFDELIDRAKITLDRAERSRLYQQAEALLAQDMPAAFIYHDVSQRLIKPWVKGYGRNPSGYIQVRDLYLTER